MKGLDKPKVNNSSYFTIGENNHNIIPKSCQLDEMINGIMSKANYTFVQSLYPLEQPSNSSHNGCMTSGKEILIKCPKDELPDHTITPDDLSQKCAGPNEKNYMVSIVSSLYVEPTNELVNIG